MSDIKFFIPKGQTIPTVLELQVDVLEESERYGFVRIWWKFHIRDAG